MAMPAGGEEDAARAAGAGAGESADSAEILRIARLMRIDVGDAGGAEAREHVEKVRTMLGYFEILDRAGVGGGEGAGGEGAVGVRLADLRGDEPEEGGAGAVEAAGRYARVQREGGAYVRAPAMRP